MPFSVHTTGEQYPGSPAAPSLVSLHPMASAHVPFPFFLLGQGIFQAATTAFMQHMRLPRPCWAEMRFSHHDPFKSISSSA